MKILYIATISDTMVFFTSHINMLLDQGHTVDMACNVKEPINQQLIERGCKVFNIAFQRFPLKIDNYLAYKKLKKLITDEKYNVVHTHTPVASVCARFACRSLKNVKVIYTAHGFHFFKGAPLLNWIIYYPIERIFAHFTDVLITINKEDYNRAKKFKAKKIEYIPGVGIDTGGIFNTIVDREIKRGELGIPKDAYVILSVGELNDNKNHETMIKALAKTHNSNLYYIICGIGKLDTYLKDLPKKLGIENNVRLLGYRLDVIEICKMSDIFAFPSKREGLPVSLMEAMAAGLPIVCSNIRGNIDLVENGKGGYWVEPNDIDGFTRYINELINSPAMCERFANINKEKIKNYDIENVKHLMKKIYEEV